MAYWVREQFFNFLRSEKTPNLVLIFSDDHYVISLAKKKIIEKVKSLNNNISIFTFDEASFSEDDILSIIRGQSLFSSTKAILISNTHKIKEKALKALLEAIVQIKVLPSYVIFEYLLEEKRHPEKYLIKFFDEKGTVAELTSPIGKNFSSWLHFLLNENDVKINPEVTEALIDYFGKNISKIVNEVEKYVAWTNGQLPSKLSDLQSFFSKEREYSMFDLYYALSLGKMRDFVNISHSMIFSPDLDHPLVYVSFLYNFFSGLLAYLGNKQVKSYLRNYYNLAKNHYTIDDLKLILKELLLADISLKGGLSQAISPEDIALNLAIRIYAIKSKRYGVN